MEINLIKNRNGNWWIDPTQRSGENTKSLTQDFLNLRKKRMKYDFCNTFLSTICYFHIIIMVRLILVCLYNFELNRRKQISPTKFSRNPLRV